MNKIYQAGIALSAGLLALSSCSSWTEVETKNIETQAIMDQLRARDMKKWAEEKELQKKEDEDTKAYNEKIAKMYDAYWQSIRDYKKSDHQITYGWFGGWSATEGLPQSFLRNLPDSVDMVAIWGGTAAFDQNSAKAKDLKYAQEVKGLKAVLCWQVADIGLGLPGGKQAIIDKVKSFSAAEKATRYGAYGITNPTEEQMQVIEYALTLTDFIEAHNLDGFDIDYEPTVGDHSRTEIHAFARTGNPQWANNMKLFIEVMSKKYGPKSGREGKILIIDGELNMMAQYFPELGDRFDWFIEQAYREKYDWQLSNRYNRLTSIKDFKAEKYIIADEFERNGGWTIGGEGSSAEDVKNGTTVSEEKARWKPAGSVRKGGWAAYHIELETPANYKYVRRAIQIMNPAKYRP